MSSELHTAKTSGGICAPRIDYEIDDNGNIHNVKFYGGCRGNAQGIAALVEGLPIEEVVKRLQGIQCRNGTSCPDQLAQALKTLPNKP
jgi:uncharacterized protein (TIGR03905 family)